MIRAIPLALRHPVESLRYEPSAAEMVSGDPSTQRSLSAKLGLLIVLGSIPGGVLGLLSQTAIEDWFHDELHTDRAVVTVAILLMVFGLILYAADLRGSKTRGLRSIHLPDAIAIGSRTSNRAPSGSFPFGYYAHGGSDARVQTC